jgi:hypothetical protein
MYPNMDQETVILSVSIELETAAQIVHADGFSVVIYDTIYGMRMMRSSGLTVKLDKTLQQGTFPPSVLHTSRLSIVCNAFYSSFRMLSGTHMSPLATLYTGRRLKGVPQGGHSSGHMANLTCHRFERSWVEQNPGHALQHSIFRYMDHFDVANAPYFMQMYQEIYHEESCIKLIPNHVTLTNGNLLECRFLDTLTYEDTRGQIHITLHDKRFEYAFFVNRFPNYDTAASRIQSHNTFYGELVRIFRINTDREGFLRNTAQTEAYLIFIKHYDTIILQALKRRFAISQSVNRNRFPWSTDDFLTVSQFYTQEEITRLRHKL